MTSRSWKYRLYPSKLQNQEMQKHLWISKEIWNNLLNLTIKKYDSEKKFFTKTELQKLVKGSGLYSQTAQAIAHRLYRALKAKINAKKAGKNWGFPRFKNFDRMKSLYYPQFGFSLTDKKIKINSIGEINIKKHREIQGEIRTLTLKKEPSGKWFAIFTSEFEQEEQRRLNPVQEIGLDLGLMNLATLSDGTIIKNPHQFKKYEKKLALAQRELSRKKKGSNNRGKAKHKVALVHEKISNVRSDFLHKIANNLLSRYSLIALEDLSISSMVRQSHSKNIYDASWGKLANILTYKAESAGCTVVFVDPRNTSKECSSCSYSVTKTLWDRQHSCPSCGLSIDRDVNAAINILNRATGGTPERNAFEEETSAFGQVSSMKKEAHGFSRG